MLIYNNQNEVDMLAITRKNIIKDIILEKKNVTVTELSEQFEVTEETIRRDLKQLEKEGFLTRTYGGAFIQSGVQNDVDISLREAAFLESKQLIGKKCAELIHNGDTIFLDASTTAAYIAKNVKDKRLTVVTNSFIIIDVLKDCPDIHLVVIGGVYSARSKAFNGRAAVAALKDYFFDKAFMSCRSLSMEHGITDSNEDTALIRQTLVNMSNELYLVADFSKFDKTSFLHICDFKDIHGVVSDYDFSDEWTAFLNDIGVMIYPCSD